MKKIGIIINVSFEETGVSTYLKTKGINPECIIMLTDGYVGNDWGTEWEAPVLWVIAGNPSTVAPNGQTIHIND